VQRRLDEAAATLSRRLGSTVLVVALVGSAASAIVQVVQLRAMDARQVVRILRVEDLGIGVLILMDDVEV
jgi:hypothetical protein